MWNKIEAILRPYKIREILEQLTQDGYDFYVEECKGFGKRLSPLALYKNQNALSIESLPRTKLTIYAQQKEIHTIIAMLLDKGSTGIIGDGKLFVLPLLNTIEIGTKEIYDEN